MGRLKVKTSIAAALLSISAAAQTLEIPHGTAMRLSGGVQVKLSNTSIDVDGTLTCDTATSITMGGTGEPALYSSAPLQLSTLGIDGSARISADNLTLTGDIVMSGQGILTLSSSTTLILAGSILGEREEGYVTGGRVEKTLPSANAGGLVNTGLGISIMPAQSEHYLKVIRTHEPQYFRHEQSIRKCYSFEPSTGAGCVALSGVSIALIAAQSPKKTDTYLIYYLDERQQWISVPADTKASSKTVQSKATESFEARKVTAFPFPELNFPKVLSPNGDNINDCFEILGLEKYPDSKFVVLTASGKIVREISPYNNDFCGGNDLPAGTYYYMFFCNKDDRHPQKKGFFELVK